MQPEAITQGPKYERDWDIWRQEAAPSGTRGSSRVSFRAGILILYTMRVCGAANMDTNTWLMCGRCSSEETL